jgi:hypothetical protein
MAIQFTIFSITQNPADPFLGTTGSQTAYFAVASNGGPIYAWRAGGIPSGSDVMAYLTANGQDIYNEANNAHQDNPAAAPIVSPWIIYVYTENNTGLPTYMAVAKVLKDQLAALPVSPTAANVAALLIAALTVLNADSVRVALFDKYRQALGVTGVLNLANITAMSVTMRSTLYISLDNFVTRGLSIGGLVTQDILSFIA